MSWQYKFNGRYKNIVLKMSLSPGNKWDDGFNFQSIARWEPSFRKTNVLKIRFSKLKKFVSRSVFGELQLRRYTYFYLSKKIYFIHSFALFLKSSKAFSVSLREEQSIDQQCELNNVH